MPVKAATAVYRVTAFSLLVKRARSLAACWLAGSLDGWLAGWLAYWLACPLSVYEQASVYRVSTVLVRGGTYRGTNRFEIHEQIVDPRESRETGQPSLLRTFCSTVLFLYFLLGRALAGNSFPRPNKDTRLTDSTFRSSSNRDVSTAPTNNSCHLFAKLYIPLDHLSEYIFR